MHTAVQSLVRSAMAHGAGKAAMLDARITHHEGDAQRVQDDVTSLWIAGHETSRAYLGRYFAALAAHPDWLTAVQQELDHVLAGAAPTPGALPRLPILRATTLETLRLYPPANNLFLREAAVPMEICGIPIAKGDLVQIVPYITQRDPRFFDGPNGYDPARFAADPTWPQFAYLPFGAGPCVCIGQIFAMIGGCDDPSAPCAIADPIHARRRGQVFLAVQRRSIDGMAAAITDDAWLRGRRVTRGARLVMLRPKRG